MVEMTVKAQGTSGKTTDSDAVIQGANRFAHPPFGYNERTSATPAQEFIELTDIALPQLAVARVRGADAATFLHGQLSADIAGLGEGAATFACYCSPRGQVLGLLLVGRAGDEFLVVADAGLLPDILQRMRMFVLRARVALEPAADLAVYGLLEGATSDGSGQVFEPAGVGLRYQRGPVSRSSAGDRDRWKAQELARNVVWLGAETSERFIPQMLGLDRIGAVSFSKGCYPGQEIIARARYLGKVKRKPLLLRVPADLTPPAGAALRCRDGAQWLDGSVVDSAVVRPGSEAGGRVLLVVMAAPEGAIKEVEFAGLSYRCATM
jgi:folate-binding protein YgfZ